MAKPVLPKSNLQDLIRRHAEYRVAKKFEDDTQQALVNLIWAQVHYSESQEIKSGVKAADEALHDQDPQRVEDVHSYTKLQLLYLSAVGKYRIGDIADARNQVRQVLAIDPSRNDANDLSTLVERKFQHRGYLCCLSAQS